MRIGRRATSSGYPEFEIGRMKFILLEDSPSLIPSYLGFFNEAHRLVKAKGLERLWYGLVFLSPQYETLSEVAVRAYEADGYDRRFVEHRHGYYISGQDTVVFTQPLTDYLVFSLTHELGHRYWYKFMDQGARGRFEDWIRIPNKPRKPYTPNLIPPEKMEAARLEVRGLIEAVLKTLAKFKASKLRWYRDILKTFDQELINVTRNLVFNISPAANSTLADPSVTPGVRKQLEDLLSLAEIIWKYFFHAQDVLEKEMEQVPEGEWSKIRDYFKKAQARWIKKALQLLQDLEKKAEEYIYDSVAAFNIREWEKVDESKIVPEPKGTVEPVSVYGRSNVREAFAEVFAKYLLGEDMSYDQLESFRSVLKKTGHQVPDPMRVVARHLEAAVPERYKHIDFKPPQAVSDEAEKGLEYRQKATPSQRGGLTPSEAAKEGIGSGVQRAVNLKNRDVISPEVIKKMTSFFSRHEKNKGVAPEHRNEPWNDKGHVSWLLWGGDPGKTWANKVRTQMEEADEELKKTGGMYARELRSSLIR
jgi:hypothetical protein